ncbi:LysR family transcriptional regulator [Telmatospirillum sp. J64-1]|uniref:LysR family transcriptional regulator n=1 Tax=Telmatospirillum sp. J64-1 TaxID=2502183 RepID=UPI00115DF8F6|nr:LysR family transcriptional regulator [Telmatospirillum sp. J64-1]
MRRYSLAQLEAFVAIAKTGSFRSAADKLGLTQPTVSLRIRELEATIGKTLFERHGTGARLTSEGLVVLTYVERGLGLFDEMEYRLKTGDPLRGILRLGSSNTFALSPLASILATLEQSYPQLQVEVTIADSNSLGAMLNDNLLDIAFMMATNVKPSVRVEPLASCEIAWLSATTANGRPATLSHDLAGKRIMTLPSTSPLYAMITEWFQATGLPQPAFSTCNDMATILRLVKAGVATSVLPVCVAEIELQAGLIVGSNPGGLLKPLPLCAAYQANAQGPGIDVILQVARHTISRMGSSVRLLERP